MTPANDSLSIGILCHPTFGGSGVVASELALTLAKRGHDLHVFSHDVPPRLANSKGNVHLHLSQALPYPLFSSTPHDLALTSRILDVHRDVGLDVLHAHYALPHTVSAFLAREAARTDLTRPAPVIVTTLHGTDITIVGSDPSYAPLTQFLISTSDCATAVSHSLRSMTEDLFCDQTGQACEIDVIPNFVDTDHFAPTDEAPLERPEVIHVSNFRPVKRVPWLVEAFAEVLKHGDAVLTLVGDGPDQRPCRELVQRLGLDDNVQFLGERRALPRLLSRATVFALSSHQESFGLSALEAMSSGTPVVATRAGGVPEVVVHGKTGYLSDVDDPTSFSQSLSSLLFDADKVRAFSVAAREHALANFRREDVVIHYEQLYRRTLESARSTT